MSDAIEYHGYCLDLLREYFHAAPERMAKNVAKQSLSQAARIGRDALKAEAHKHDGRGFLATTRSGREKQKHLADTVTMVQKGYGDNQYVAVGFAWPSGAHGYLVEFGHRMVVGGSVARESGKQAGHAPKTKNPALRGTGRVVGQVPPHPIALPAFQSVVGEMQAVFTAAVQARAERALLNE